MPATFINTSGGDLFKRQSGGASHLVQIPSIDSVVGSGGLAVYDSISVQLGETIQYFLTFDDVIKFIHFGKGIGNITASGTLFSNCQGDIPGLAQLFGAFQGLRGQQTVVTVGEQGFTAVVTNVNVNIVAEPDTMAAFQVVFSIVNHNM
jgi:hypothetical protein